MIKLPPRMCSILPLWLWIAPLLIGLAMVVVWSQQETGTADVNPRMLKVCPELEQAAGRKKEQLLLLFFQLSDEKLEDAGQKQTIQRAFDFSNADDVALIEEYVLRDQKARCQHGLRVLFASSGSKGLLKALEWYADQDATGRARILELLRDAETREVYRLLGKALEDERPVATPFQGQMPPGASPRRVCDTSYRTLAAKLTGEIPSARAKRPENLPKDLAPGTGVGPSVPVEERQKEIDRLQAWLRDPQNSGYAAFLRRLPSVLSGLAGDEERRAREILKSAGIESD